MPLPSEWPLTGYFFKGKMAKRFTDTEKWRDPWFCGLSAHEKNFWSFLLDTCNMAGIWQVNWPLVNFYIPNFDFKKDVFGDRIQALKDDKWFIPKFIKFQYGDLQPTNRLHQRIIFELQKEGVSIPLKYPSQGVKDKDMVKDKVQVKKGGVGENKAFAEFWEAYPKKVGKGAAERAWKNIGEVPIEQLLATLGWQKKSFDWIKDGGKFIPYPATWLNQRRWEDEPEHTGNGRRHSTIFDKVVRGPDEGVREKTQVGGLPEL